MKLYTLLLAGVFVASPLITQANVIADWTFDVSQPTTAGPIAPEIGSGSATAVGLTSITGTSGNPGTGKSFSGPGWNVGDYWQFQVSTVGFKDITISYDQEGSATGPRDFILQYSVNGSTFSAFGGAYSLGSTANSWTAHPADLSSIITLNNVATVYFRVVDNSTTSINAGTVAATGTDRIDNFIVNGTVVVVPEPSSIALALMGGFSCLVLIHRARR